jgi:hypothetical protein
LSCTAALSVNQGFATHGRCVAHIAQHAAHLTEHCTSTSRSTAHCTSTSHNTALHIARHTLCTVHRHSTVHCTLTSHSMSLQCTLTLHSAAHLTTARTAHCTPRSALHGTLHTRRSANQGHGYISNVKLKPKLTVTCSKQQHANLQLVKQQSKGCKPNWD